MKKIWMILMMVGLHQITASAQDLIVTADGDSLNCKITQIRGDYVYFTFKYQNEVRNTFLPVTQVKQYQYSFFTVSDVQAHQIVGYKPEFPHWRLAFNAGWSCRTAPFADSLSPSEKEYLKKLRNGFNISLDANYFFTEMFGAGFKYDFFKSSTSQYGGKESISITFAGPAFAMRLYDRNKTNCLFMNYSIGYMGYMGKAELSGQSGTRKGSTAGFVTEIGYDIALSKNWSAGVQLSLLSGILTEYTENINGVTQKVKLEKDKYEGLGRLNIAIGFRCNL